MFTSPNFIILNYLRTDLAASLEIVYSQMFRNHQFLYFSRPIECDITIGGWVGVLWGGGVFCLKFLNCTSSFYPFWGKFAILQPVSFPAMVFINKQICSIIYILYIIDNTSLYIMRITRFHILHYSSLLTLCYRVVKLNTGLFSFVLSEPFTVHISYLYVEVLSKPITNGY